MRIRKERSAPTAQETLPNTIFRRIRRNEEQLFLVLTLVIGVVVGLTIVAFVVLTERVGLRLYPVGAQPWRRLFMPVAGSVFFIAIFLMLAQIEVPEGPHPSGASGIFSLRRSL